MPSLIDDVIDAVGGEPDHGTLRDRVRRQALRIVNRGICRDLDSAIDRILAIRRRPNRGRYAGKYVRAVRSDSGCVLFQARGWHPVVGSVNIGLFRSEREAAQAARNWMRSGGDPCKGLSNGVLPKWVVVAEGGYRSVLKLRGVPKWFGPVRESAVVAHEDALGELRSRGVIVARDLALPDEQEQRQPRRTLFDLLLDPDNS